eukprot:CAMPEP_0194164142 /NCGR_PEP_ID=MMETSP0154-20130528/266_1 /TAXON_ID=1049557 /ORGANISM="Thalassiothrix antarctica, Strain L6-D1" /LENGTH=48 /DNA_ID= /DNA_START= /DNA_END= /DNA_ORIENTATION=
MDVDTLYCNGRATTPAKTEQLSISFQIEVESSSSTAVVTVEEDDFIYA